MTIPFKCTSCGAGLNAPDEMAGRKAKCRKCGATLQVPNPAADRWPPGMAPPGAAPAARQTPPSRAAAPSVRPTAKPAAPAAPQARPAPRERGVPTAQPAARAVPAVPVQPAPPPSVPPPAIPVAAPLEPQVQAESPFAVPEHVTPVERDDIDDLLDFERPPTAAIPAVEPVAPVNLHAPSGEFAPVAQDDLAAMLDFETSSTLPPASNPYASPRSTTLGAAAADEHEFVRVRYGDTIGTAWAIFKANFARAVGGTLLSGISYLFAQGFIVTLLQLMVNGMVALQWGSPGVVFLISVIALCAVFSVAAYLALGYFKYMLDIARGQKPDLANLFNLTSLILPGLLMFAGIVVAVFVGSLLLVPGLIIAILCLLSPIALVDKQEGVVAAVRLSARIMSRNFLPAFLLLATCGLLANFVFLLTCGIGGLVTVPFQAILAAVIYLRASREPTAADSGV